VLQPTFATRSCFHVVALQLWFNFGKHILLQPVVKKQLVDQAVLAVSVV
jgi:hypothetical protein